MKDSPWRAVLIGSSSWSHAFLTAKNHFLYPDIAAARRRYEDIKAGNQGVWRDVPLADIEQAGQHEFLNWSAWLGR